MCEEVRIIQLKFQAIAIRHTSLLDTFGKFFKNCTELISYCEKVREKESSCYEIYLSEITTIITAIEVLKTNTNNYEALETMSMSIVLDYWNRFDIVLNGAEFYKNYVVIDVSPPEEITKLKAEIKSYVEKGRILKESPLSEQLKNELLQLKFIDDLPSYYAALVGPSLMGKTQTAFTLSHSMNVFYVNFASFYLEMSAPTEQRIYRALGPLSKFFFKAVWADIDATNYLKGESNEGATFFSDDSRKFITLGLIYTLLKWKDLNSAEFDSHPEKWFSSFLTMKRIVIKSLTRDQFMSKMRGKELKSIKSMYL